MLSAQLSTTLVTSHVIKITIANDPVLSKVLRFVLNGWPIIAVSEELKPYYRRREEISHFEEYKNYVVGLSNCGPPQSQEIILKTLYGGILEVTH